MREELTGPQLAISARTESLSIPESVAPGPTIQPVLIVDWKDVRSRYAALDRLLGHWFDPDYMYEGGTLEEIIAEYRRASYDHEIRAARSDILRFITEFGSSDVALAEAFVAVFSLGVRVEGWDGMSTRQWLEQIAALLALTRRSISAVRRSTKLQAISRAPSASSTR